MQLLLQIIINRIALLIPNKQKVWYIKWGVAALITAVNISVYCIWVPARLQISEEYVHINEIWDRCEKGIYLIVDGILNWYFLRLVNTNLIKAGITKYKRLYNFNAFIVGVSLCMDVLIIAMMNLKNSFVYVVYHHILQNPPCNIQLTKTTQVHAIPPSSLVSPLPSLNPAHANTNPPQHRQAQHRTLNGRPNNQSCPPTRPALRQRQQIKQ